eukprot:1704486-Pleurochrysis_carterae.AAC.1
MYVSVRCLRIPASQEACLGRAILIYSRKHTRPPGGVVPSTAASSATHAEMHALGSNQGDTSLARRSRWRGVISYVGRASLPPDDAHEASRGDGHGDGGRDRDADVASGHEVVCRLFVVFDGETEVSARALDWTWPVWAGLMWMCMRARARARACSRAFARACMWASVRVHAGARMHLGARTCACACERMQAALEHVTVAACLQLVDYCRV